MSIKLNQITTGIDQYRDTFPTRYELIKKYIDPVIMCLSVGKIETNLNPSLTGKAKEVGIYQFLPTTLKSVIKSYSKNVDKIYSLYLKNISSQTFIFMQSLYLNIKQLEREKTLYKEYEKVINVLPGNIQNPTRLAILHNAGVAAFNRLARVWDPRIHYIPQFTAVYLAAFKKAGGKV